jgi:hypothetical protein
MEMKHEQWNYTEGNIQGAARESTLVEKNNAININEQFNAMHK